MKTVGKKVFMINHYWLRYEFAPSRGQIHAHLLVITDHNKFLQSAMDKFKDHTKMADILSEWMEKSFGMTASMPINASVDIIPCQETKESRNRQKESNTFLEHPSNFTFTDIDNQKKKQMNRQEVHIEDTNNLFNNLQIHRCNAYCMRKRNHW